MANLKYFWIVLLALTSCKKSDNNSTLKGTWELVSQDGGWSGHQEFSPGNGNLFTFTGNHYAQQIATSDTTLHYSGSFRIYEGRPCEGAADATLIQFDDDSYSNTLSIAGNILTLRAPHECIADVPDRTYRKINE